MTGEAKANDVIAEPDSGYWRLEDQIKWYDKKSIRAQSAYKCLKAVQIVVAALVPASALLLTGSGVVPGILGGVILILEGFQELGAYHRNWIKYRTTCESLRHEKYLFLVRSGPYDGLDPEVAKRELAIRVEAMVSEEHTHWSSYMTSKLKERSTKESAKRDRSSAGV